MNSLSIDLTGKVVELRAECLQPGVDNRFLCEHGFGLHPFTSGRKIAGRFVADGCEAVINGDMVAKLHHDQSVRPAATEAATSGA